MEPNEPNVPRTPREGALIRGAEALRRDGATIYAEELDALLAEVVAELDRDHELDVLSREVDRPLPLAAIDQEGKRTDAPEPVHTIETAAELRRVRELAERVGVDRFRIEPDHFRDHGEEIRFHRSLQLLTLASSPIPGRDGWRRSRDGREWYSDAWLGQAS